MSFKPKIIVSEEVITLLPPLYAKKDELTIARDQISERLATIEMVIKENEVLEAKTKEQVSESVNIFLEEWKKSKEYYPEVRLGVLQKALEFITVDPKKKKK